MRRAISASKLLALRRSNNLTYRQLSDAINKLYEPSVMVSPASLNRWETQPNCHVSIRKLSAIAEYFGVPVDDLLLESAVETIVDIEPKKIPLDSIRVELLKKIVTASETELLLISDFMNKL